MELILTPDMMMDQWRLRRGVEPLRADSTLERAYGIDMDRLLQAEMDSWYAHLLDTAPPSMLAPVNLASTLELTALTGLPGGAQTRLPSEVRRVFSVRLAHWLSAVSPVPLDSARHLLRCQSNPFTAATPQAPLAVLSGSQLMMFPATPLSVMTVVEAVTDQSPTLYRLDSSALGLITPNTPLLL